MMNCAITGAVPEHPVISLKSGAIFEKRNIEEYIAQHGTDPVSGDDLGSSELIDIKAPRAVKPRPATLTSVPSLLSAFQNEWDALALEAYNLKQQLAQTRQQLGTALFEYQSALKIIDEVTRQRDEARDALSKVSVGGSTQNGDDETMAVDAITLPDNYVEKMEATAKELSAVRRKRPVPDGWATVSQLQELMPKDIPQFSSTNSKILATNAEKDYILISDESGVVLTSTGSDAPAVHLKHDSATPTTALFWDSRAVVAYTSGEIKVFEADGAEVASLKAHSGSCNDLVLHPTGDILASAGGDRCWIMHDLNTMTMIARIVAQSELLCADVHPDGKLFVVGSRDGKITLFDTPTGAVMANFEHDNPITSVAFSENGTLLAVVVAGGSEVLVYNLRSGTPLEPIAIEGTPVQVRWDASGQFLAVASSESTSIFMYNKKAKTFDSLLTAHIASRGIVWGPLASSLLVLKSNGEIAALN